MQVPDFLQNAENGLKKGAFSALWEISFTNTSERLDFLKKFEEGWEMSRQMYEFYAVIEAVPEKGGAYVLFHHDIKEELENIR